MLLTAQFVSGCEDVVQSFVLRTATVTSPTARNSAANDSSAPDPLHLSTVDTLLTHYSELLGTHYDQLDNCVQHDTSMLQQCHTAVATSQQLYNDMQLQLSATDSGSVLTQMQHSFREIAQLNSELQNMDAVLSLLQHLTRLQQELQQQLLLMEHHRYLTAAQHIMSMQHRLQQLLHSDNSGATDSTDSTGLPAELASCDIVRDIEQRCAANKQLLADKLFAIFQRFFCVNTAYQASNNVTAATTAKAAARCPDPSDDICFIYMHKTTKSIQRKYCQY